MYWHSIKLQIKLQRRHLAQTQPRPRPHLWPHLWPHLRWHPCRPQLLEVLIWSGTGFQRPDHDSHHRFPGVSPSPVTTDPRTALCSNSSELRVTTYSRPSNPVRMLADGPPASALPPVGPGRPPCPGLAPPRSAHAPTPHEAGLPSGPRGPDPPVGPRKIGLFHGWTARCGTALR